MRTLYFASLVLCIIVIKSTSLQAQLNCNNTNQSDLTKTTFSFSNSLVPNYWDNDLTFYSSLEKNINKSKWKTNLQISSIGFGVSYVAPLIVDLVEYSYDDYWYYLLIPVAGPYLHLGIAGKDYYYSDALWGLLIFDAIAQTAFATYFVISLSKNSKAKKSNGISITTSMSNFTLCYNF